MSGSKPLALPCDVIFAYDGTFNGFLCCVYESVYSGEIPLEIAVTDDAPISLMPTRYIDTEPAKAARVLASIPDKISPAALELTETVFFSCLNEKELLLLRFLLRGYREGRGIVYKLSDPDIAPLLRAQKHLAGEAHLLKGFIRFSDFDGVLAGTISPKNFVLPFIAEHFVQRYDDEDFMIFDKTHKAALIYQNRHAEIISLDSITFPDVSEAEERYRAMWKQFYKTVSIEARENPKCRMTHMPKRYWENMLEVRELLF